MGDDFSIEALYAAVDTERAAHGLTWAQLTCEVNGLYHGVQVHAISPSTISGMRSKSWLEGDGVLQVLRWLNRTPESFVIGYAGPQFGDEALPRIEPTQMLRFDTRALYADLNTERLARQRSWVQLATEIGGVNASGLTRYADGGRTGFPQIVRIARWLRRPVASFSRAFER
jgi:hypothetical protein